jgi:hypothetical protein
MLPPMSPLLSFPTATSAVGLNKVARRSSQVMIPTQQLLVVLVVNQSLPPEVVEQVEIRSRGPQRMPKHGMIARDVLHPGTPARSTVFRRCRPVA